MVLSKCPSYCTQVPSIFWRDLYPILSHDIPLISSQRNRRRCQDMPRLTRVSGHGLGRVGVQMDYPDGLLIFAVQACQGLSSLQPADAAGWTLESQERRWGGSMVMGLPTNGGFTMKMNDLEVPPLQETPICKMKHSGGFLCS